MVKTSPARCGGGIYFAMSPEATQTKAILVASVTTRGPGREKKRLMQRGFTLHVDTTMEYYDTTIHNYTVANFDVEV